HRGGARDSGQARRPRIHRLDGPADDPPANRFGAGCRPRVASWHHGRIPRNLYTDVRALCRTGMGDDEKRKAFLKGFEEGLKSAWREIGSLTTRGYSSTELGVLAKSKLAVLFRDVEAMESRLIEEEGIPVAGGGELSARSDVGRRGVYLVREPKAERVFPLFSDLLQKVNEKITLNDSYLLISANPAAMKEQEYRLLAKEVAAEI